MDGQQIIAEARRIMRGLRVAGQRDCLFDVAQLVAAISGRDIFGGLIVVYDSEAEAMAIAEAQGGLVAATGAALTAAGMRAVDVAAPGDVGLVRAPESECGAVYAVSLGRGSWVSRGLNGPALFRGEPLGVWTWA